MRSLERWWSRARSRACWRLHDDALATEVADGALHSLVLEILSGALPDHVEAWITTVVDRREADLLRTRRHDIRLLSGFQLDRLRAPDPEPSPIAAWRARLDALEPALRTLLTPRHARVYDALRSAPTIAEVARRTRLTPGQVRRVLAAIAKKARKLEQKRVPRPD